jgi:Effector-associated domain 11
MTNQPTLLMTFAANNLAGVKTESDKIWKSVKNNTLVKATKISNATIDKLAESIFDCGKDLVMFHFGGHADQKGIVLDGFKDIDKIRLSRLLLPNEKHNVQLIFLNGCLSYGHVGILTAKGVKAIIATNVKVDDTEAVRMAAFFYKLFFEKDYTLKEAFETAEATVSGKNAYITIVNPGEIDESQPLNASWTLFVHTQHKYVMDWRLADFIKTTEPKTAETTGNISQTHSGTGDIIAGSKIGKQINMGSGSTYIENPAPSQTPPPPKVLNLKETIQDLVAHGQLNAALIQIAPKLPEYQQNTVILLRGRVYQLEQNQIQGIVSAEQFNIERNRLANAILSLLTDLA